MKILLKAQACLPLHLPLGFMPHLLLLSCYPLHPRCKWTWTGGARPSISGAGSGWSQGAGDSPGPWSPHGPAAPSAGRTPRRPGWAPFCPARGPGGGACVHSQRAGGLRPLVFCQPLSFPLSYPSPGHVDALQACWGAPSCQPLV